MGLGKDTAHNYSFARYVLILMLGSSFCPERHIQAGLLHFTRQEHLYHNLFFLFVRLLQSNRLRGREINRGFETWTKAVNQSQ